MRSLNNIIALVTLLISFNIFAARQGPVVVGEGMQVLAGSFKTNEITDIKVAMNKYDEAELPSSISVEFEIVENRELFQRTMKIVSIESGVCGSYEYVALNDEVPFEKEQIVVFDHSDRFCKDFKPYAWEVSITSLRLAQDRDGDEVVLGGWPVSNL